MSQVVVEFFGPPASGKSTLARETAGRLDRQGIEVANPFYTLAHDVSDSQRYLRKSVRVCRTLGLSPKYSQRAMRAIYDTDQQTVADFVTVAFNWLYLAGEITSAKADVTILDQGLIQATSSIMLSGDSRYAIGRTLPPLLERPDEYVVVAVGVRSDILERRLASRHENPSRVGSRYSLEAQFEAEDRTTDVVNEAVRTDRAHLIRVQNDREDDVSRNVSQIVAQIHELLPGESRD